MLIFVNMYILIKMYIIEKWLKWAILNKGVKPINIENNYKKSKLIIESNISLVIMMTR